MFLQCQASGAERCGQAEGGFKMFCAAEGELGLLRFTVFAI